MLALGGKLGAPEFVVARLAHAFGVVLLVHVLAVLNHAGAPERAALLDLKLQLGRLHWSDLLLGRGWC